MKTTEITLPVKVEAMPERAERRSKPEYKSVILDVIGVLCLLPITYVLMVLFLALERV